MRPREMRPRLGKGRVERDGLLVIRDRALQRVCVCDDETLRRLTLQIGIVRGEIRRRLLSERLSLPAAERNIERARDLIRDVRLHLEDIGDRGIEGLLPFRSGRMPFADVHQLGAHAHAARAVRALLPLHGCGEQVVGAELACDLLRRLRRVAVLGRAAARDHLDRAQLRQLAAQFVRDPVGEIRIGGIAEILERQHREHLGASCGRRELRLAPRKQDAETEKEAHDERRCEDGNPSPLSAVSWRSRRWCSVARRRCGWDVIRWRCCGRGRRCHS